MVRSNVICDFNRSLVQRGISHLANKNRSLRKVNVANNDLSDILASIRLQLEELLNRTDSQQISINTMLDTLADGDQLTSQMNAIINRQI